MGPTPLYSLLAESASQCVCIDAVYSSESNQFHQYPHQPWQIRFATRPSLASSCCMPDCKGFFRASSQSIHCSHLEWVSLVCVGSTKVSIHKSTNRWQSCIASCISKSCYRITQLILYWEDRNRWSIYGEHHVGSDVRIYHLDVIGNTPGWTLTRLEHPISSSMIIGTFFLSYANHSLFIGLIFVHEQADE